MSIKKLTFKIVSTLILITGSCLANTSDPLFDMQFDFVAEERQEKEMREYFTAEILKGLHNYHQRLVASEQVGDYRTILNILDGCHHSWTSLYNEHKNPLYLTLARKELETMIWILQNHDADFGDSKTNIMMWHECEARIAMLAGDYAKARKEANIIVHCYAHEGASPDILGWWQAFLGEAVYKLGDTEQGERIMESAVQRIESSTENPKFNTYRISHIYLTLARLCVDDHRFREAITYIQKHRQVEHMQDSLATHQMASKLVQEILQQTGYRSINEYLLSTDK